MDDLTDVYNRRFFIEQVEKELAKTVRYGTVFSILAVDIDHFKKINERHGHFAGDAVLQAMANTCMNNLRAMDGPFAAFKDTAGMERACRIGRARSLSMVSQVVS